jgi:hypothetical protein
LSDRFLFEVLGQRIAVLCPDAELRGLIAANWGSLATTGAGADVEFEVRRVPASIVWNSSSGAVGAADDASGLLFDLDQAVIVELQRRRADLYFLHAAAAERDGRACLLIAPSGSGKSTTEWALLQHGFGYLSDELAPIDLATLKVHAYPHALCVKQSPPEPYRLPAETVGERRWYVPATAMPRLAGAEPRPISAALFLTYCPQASGSAIRPIAAAEAAARLYAHALNPLAHPNAGLTAAAHLAQNVPALALDSADLAATCALIEETLRAIDSDRPPAPGVYS